MRWGPKGPPSQMQIDKMHMEMWSPEFGERDADLIEVEWLTKERKSNNGATSQCETLKAYYNTVASVS